MWLQSKLHLLQHDRGFLQSNLKYLTELGNKVRQYAEETRAGADAEAEAHAREAARRRNVVEMRASLAEQQRQNRERQERKAALAEQLTSLKVCFSCPQNF